MRGLRKSRIERLADASDEQARGVHDGLVEVGLLVPEDSVQVGAVKIGVGENGSGKIGAAGRGFEHVGAREIGLGQIGPEQYGVFEIGFRHFGFG